MTKQRKTPKLPNCDQLTRLIKSLKRTIEDDYRAPGCEDDKTPSMQLTIGWSPDAGDWGYQTGDNSFMGAAYHYPMWAVVEIHRRSNSAGVARDIRAQLDEQVEG